MSEEQDARLEWWGYQHENGHIQVKRYFDRRDTEEAQASPFVRRVFGPFLATGREDAVKKVQELLI